MVVEQSLDGGTHWNPIPLRLDFRSRIVLWTSASPFWPPEVPIGMGCTEGEVWFDYVDAPDEQPRWLRRHALWRATYLQETKRWRIRERRPDCGTQSGAHDNADPTMGDSA